MVYLIVCDETQTAKIGVSDNPEKRLRSLQTGHPYTLRIECVMDGDESRERIFHENFRDTRLRGEWFLYTPEMSETFQMFKELSSMSPERRDLLSRFIGIIIRAEGNEEVMLQIEKILDELEEQQRVVEWAFNLAV